MDELDLSQFKDVFVAEAKENLVSLNASLVELEKNPQNLDILKEIFRVAHTLKGMSATMGFEKITSLTHHMEDVLDKLKKGEAKPTGDIVNVIFDCFDALEKLVEEVETGVSVKIDIDGLINRVTGLVSETRQESPVSEAPAKKDEQQPAPPVIQEGETKKDTAAVQQARPSAGVDVRPQRPQEQPSTTAADTSTAVIEKKSATIRINISHLDTMMNLVGEMVIAKSQLEQISSRYKIDELQISLQQFDRIAIDLQEAVLKTRMVPISQIFDRYPRMVRDISRKLGKEINFEIYGSDIEIDRLLLDEINEPLVHLLRNAIDHGIESPQERQQKGKNPAGRVVLGARRERGYISIEVSDDGRGLDYEIIKKKAVEKDIITQEEAKQLSEEDALMLICDPRFSTAEKITDISGRGVGMDVVKSMIEAFSGRLNIKSIKDAGTTFTLMLPLSMAIISSLLMKVGNERYAIPLNNITEIISLSPSDIKSIGNKKVILLRDEVLPLVCLGEKFGLYRLEDLKENFFVLRVEAGNKVAAFVVNELIGRKEIVIKTLSGIVKYARGFSGATILGDGSVVLIIDVGSLI